MCEPGTVGDTARQCSSLRSLRQGTAKSTHLEFNTSHLLLLQPRLACQRWADFNSMDFFPPSNPLPLGTSPLNHNETGQALLSFKLLDQSIIPSQGFMNHFSSALLSYLKANL